MDMHTSQHIMGSFPYHRLCDGVLLLDHSHLILDADEAICRWLNMSKEELLGRSWPSLFQPQDRAVIDANLATLFATGNAQTLLQGFHNQQGIDQIYLHLYLNSSSPDQYYALFLNLGARVNYTSAKRRYEKLFELSHDLLCIANTLGYFLQVNPAFTRLLGYTSEELINTSFLEFIHPDDVDATVNEIRNLRSGMDTTYFENRYRCKDGSWLWLAWSTPAPGNDGLLYAVGKDITERKEAEQRLQLLAKYDVISGLPNQGYLEDEAHRAIARARRNGSILAGIAIQLPQLANIESLWGKVASEELVLQYSLRLRQQLRINDFVAHTAPNRFFILLEATSSEQLALVERKLQALARMTFHWDQYHQPIVGKVSPPRLYQHDNQSPAEWLQDTYQPATKTTATPLSHNE